MSLFSANGSCERVHFSSALVMLSGCDSIALKGAESGPALYIINLCGLVVLYW